MTVLRAAAEPDVNYLVERSTNLMSWSVNGTQLLNDGLTQLQVRSRSQGLAQEFFRLRVELK